MCGVASRRASETLIREGRVTVNGERATIGREIDPESDDVAVNGEPVRREKPVYILLNKPKGVICTNSDPRGRKKAVDMIETPQRIFCVGRLDMATSGLIILTNDSKLSNRLTHPRYELPKTYEVTVKGTVDPKQIEKLKKGVWLSEGRTERAAVKILKKGRNQTVLEITIRQGLNRQVRRTLARTGIKVKSLKRTRIGSINIKGLGIGKYRPLKKAELDYLRKATAGKH